jgi:DNA-binding transcriptional LysR family regulator
MELRQLRYFVAVAEHGAISHAARSLFIAQPALTKQMHQLEEELGVRLFERLSRGVALTAAGHQFLKDVSKIHDDLLQAKQNAQRADQGRIGNIALGLTILHRLLPDVAKVLRQFRERSPDVSLTLRHLLSGPQVDKIRDGELDAGFLYFRPMDDRTLSGLLFSRQRLMLVMPNERRWTDSPPRRLSDLNGRDFIWFPRQATPAYHDQLISEFRRAGFLPHVVMEGTDNNALLTLVTAGMGCTILPELARAHASEDVVFLALEDLSLEMPLELVWRSDNTSPVLERLIRCAADIMDSGAR